MKFRFQPFDIEFQTSRETIKRLEDFVKSGSPITLERKGYGTVQGRLKKGTSSKEYSVVFQRYPHVIEEISVNPNHTHYSHNCTFRSEGKSSRKFHYKGKSENFDELSKFLGQYNPET